ncbi:MAG TPA: hypothetical protein VKV40_04580 [Ktedonobacteraceae bacterium]|nr:hypothetical protein [Ktedonobacteraceae bacterium]
MLVAKLSSRSMRMVLIAVLRSRVVLAVIVACMLAASLLGLRGAVPVARASATSFGGWDYTVIGLTPSGGRLAINNYNPTNGDHVKLVANNPPASTTIDGVSPNGTNVLYQVTGQNGYTRYYTLVQIPHTGYFYRLASNNAGNAIWEADSVHVLVATVSNGVQEVDVQSGTVTALFPSLSDVVPTFYSKGYLYFTGGQNPSYSPAELYRANTTTGQVENVTSFPSIDTIYWLAPTASTIYFANKIGPGGQSGIYSVNVDGSNLQWIRPYADARPVGFAADNALEFMRFLNNRFQLWKLGATSQQDSVVMDNVAPGASELCSYQVNPGITPLCESNIALAPYGHALIVLALYSNSSLELWSDNLVTGKKFVILRPTSSTTVQLPGWDRIPVQ